LVISSHSTGMPINIFMKNINIKFQDISGHIWKKGENFRTFKDISGQKLNFRTFQDFPGLWTPCILKKVKISKSGSISL
jgi:hypothetical protein